MPGRLTGSSSIGRFSAGPAPDDSQATSLPADTTKLEATVTFTNTTGATIPNVYYSRVLDPDNCVMSAGSPCAGDYQTTNTVQLQKKDGDPVSSVSASAADGSFLDLRTDADSVVAISSAFCILTDIATVFANPASCSLNATKGASVHSDSWIYLLAQTGPIAPGDSASITFKYVLSAVESAADSSPTTTTTTTTEPTTTTTTTTTTTEPTTTTTTTQPTTTTTTTTTTPPPPPPATVPDAPTKVSAKGADNKAVVTFDVPGSGGSAITKYQYRLGSKAWTTVSTSPVGVTSASVTPGSVNAGSVNAAVAHLTRSFTIGGLTNGTTYPVQVRAVNAVGAGTPSSTVKVFVNSPAPKVSKPKEAVRVPAKPRAYQGPRKATVARWTARNGTPAPAIPKLDDHALVKGEAATLSKKSVFRFDSATLTKSGRAEVKQLAKRLKAAKAIRCEGYTDYAGPDSNHAKLGTARAKAVCKALKAYGADVKVTLKNYKGSRPAVVGGKAQTRDENRRVVVLVTADRR